MLRSMTGIGVGVDDDGRRRVTVEVRSVNHRHLKLSFKAPPLLQPLESEFETRLRAKHGRGAVNASIVVQDPSVDAAAKLDVEAIIARVAELHGAADRLRTTLSDAEALSLALRLPGAFRAADESAAAALDDGLKEAVFRAAERAFERLAESRAAEGAKILGWLREHAAECAGLRGKIAARAPEIVRGLRDRFAERAATLLAEVRPGLALSEETLLREAAAYAERTDVAEELDRLAGHLRRFEEIATDGRDAGRKLDFLSQELLREANTIGSKASDLTVAHLVVELKTAIEKFKEQVQNLE
jgi:uncharacterized protein (TIGR00255 family)